MKRDIPEIETFLLSHVAEFVEIPKGYNEQLIRLNLLYLFCQNDYCAVKFIDFVEKQLQIAIPDYKVDYFFISDLRIMAEVVASCL